MKQYRGLFLFLPKNTFPALKKNSPFNLSHHCTRPRSALGTGSTRNLKKMCGADFEKTSMKVLSERGEVGGFRRSENSEKIGNAPPFSKGLPPLAPPQGSEAIALTDPDTIWCFILFEIFSDFWQFPPTCHIFKANPPLSYLPNPQFRKKLVTMFASLACDIRT